MMNNEYFSNCYHALITNKFFHSLILLLEYFITFLSQITLYTIKFEFKYDEEIPNGFFYAVFIQKIHNLQEYIKLLIIIIIFALTFIYLIVYTKFSFKKKNLFNLIIINFFEIFIFRLFLIIILNILLAIKGIPGIIMAVISILFISLIMKNIHYIHLHYFAPHFIVFPYDYFSSITDSFHIVEKICLSIAFQSGIKPFNEFLFIFCFILQIANLIHSIYILHYRSYYIMSNIFLNKLRLSIFGTSVILDLILVFFRHKNLLLYTYLVIGINVLLIEIIVVQIFYNPYSHSYFSTDDKIENLYFYYYIIDHLKNDSFLLEEKLQAHLIKCQKCNLCKNLKSYLEKKNCYKKVYKILFNKNSVLEDTLNEIIHNVLVKGKEALKYNSFYLINILYCYYLNMNKKNYVLSYNLKLIFEIINLENKNILENHLLSTEQITLINEFLSKADNILDKIRLILTETTMKEKLNQFFTLYEVLFELKSKKFKNKLYYNKNEGIVNFFKYISICSMIYEEIFNVSLSNGGLSLKENQIFLDDIANKNNAKINQIIIQLDLLSFHNKIIYITGELAKFKGKTLCQLFPNVIKGQQLVRMKKKIMNSKYLTYINKDKDFFQINKGQNNDDKYINLQLLIYDEENNKKIFVIIKLLLNLIYPVNLTKQILLTGFYSTDKNVVITLDKSTNESKKEIVLNSEDNKFQSEIMNYSFNEIELIKFKKNDKYYKGKKLLFVTKFYVNPNCYNVYSIFHSEKQKTFRKSFGNEEDKKNINNLFDMESKKNIYTGAETNNQNFNFMMQESQTSSTFAQISNDVQNFKKREKSGKKDKKNSHYFQYFQIGILFLSLLILLFQIIVHYSLNKSIVHIGNQNDAVINLRQYSGIYNYLFSSILSISCLSHAPKADNCTSVINFYQYALLKRPGPPLFVFLFMSGKGTCYALIDARNKILKILINSKDKSLNSLLNSETISLSISQNITSSGNKLLALKQKIPFIDVMNYMTNAIVVLTSEINNLDVNRVYILNKVDINGNWNSSEIPFINVRLSGQLSEYQYNFYYLLLNFQQFVVKLNEISDNLFNSTSNTIFSNVSFIKVIIVVIFVFTIILQGIIYIYIISYFKILAVLFNDIEKKLDLKNDDISVREMFLQKIEKLKIIISLYKQDIYQAIVDLNFIYDNYKKFIEEKNKEMAKLLKREKFLNERIMSSNNKAIKEIQKNISLIPVNRSYLYYIALCSLASLIISVIIFLIWTSYESTYKRIYHIIEYHGALSTNGYKIVSYYQLMLYNSITVEDINKLEGLDSSKDEDIFQKIYTDLENLYELKKYTKKIDKYNLDNLYEYFNHNCNSFVNQLFEIVFALKSNPSKETFKSTFLEACEMFNVLQSKDYKYVFSMLFEITLTGINEINDHSYMGLMQHLRSINYSKRLISFIFLYFNIFEILSYRVQRETYIKVFELIDSYLLTGFVIYYIASFIFILIIILVYIYKFKKNYYKLHEMKKVFKICNKQE